MNDKNNDNSYINSLVGKGTHFDGELNLSGLLRIDGDFTGSINSDGKVLIGRSGRVKCSINAESVIIGGIVKGNIFSSDKVVVLSTGMVLGNIGFLFTIKITGAITANNNVFAHCVPFVLK